MLNVFALSGFYLGFCACAPRAQESYEEFALGGGGEMWWG